MAAALSSRSGEHDAARGSRCPQGPGTDPLHFLVAAALTGALAWLGEAKAARALRQGTSSAAAGC